MDSQDSELEANKLVLRLGFRNGALIGLALALGAWAPDAILLGSTHLRLFYPSLIVGCAILLALGGLSGWLAARVDKPWFGALLWLAAGTLMTAVIGHVPYEGRTWTVWLADRRSWGLPIYAFDEAAGTGMVLAGFFILLLLGFLGLVQTYRLHGVAGEVDPGGRLLGRGLFMIFLPLPFVLAVGLIADNMVNQPLRTAPQLVHEAIRTGRTYEGDLFALSRESGVNYNAIAPVRDLMSEVYTLSIGSIDLSASETVYVVADFDNGAWVNCRVVADQLSYCYDASPPYMRGFPALLTTGQPPGDCPSCSVSVSEEQRSWLLARSQAFEGSPRVTRLAQWGSNVLISAESPAGDYGLECRFQGMSPVRLESCRVVGE